MRITTGSGYHEVPRFHAELKIVWPDPDNPYADCTGHARCDHDHTSRESAQACADRMAREIRRSGQYQDRYAGERVTIPALVELPKPLAD